MAVCMSNLSQVTRANTLYATSNDNFFIDRVAAQSTGYGTPYQVYYSGRREDDRHYFQELNLWDIGCPFVKRLADITSSLYPSSSIRYSYSVFYGWKHNDSTKLTHMLKPLEYNGTEFNIVGSDILHIRQGGDLAISSHEGKKSVGYSWLRPSNTLSQDTNFARNEGSVYTMKNVTPTDSRMMKVPYELGSRNVNNDYLLLPKEMK
jgi:hypothetical protein